MTTTLTPERELIHLRYQLHSYGDMMAPKQRENIEARIKELEQR